MKVYISKYRHHWVSPYKICEVICFWREIDYYEPWVKLVNKILEPVMKVWMNFLDVVHPKIDYVKIDGWDTWSMDHTLGLIILPMLKQLQQDKHGYPITGDEDVPEYLQSHMAQPKEYEWDADSLAEQRWDWILNEMIFAFEHLIDESWQEEYRSGEVDFTFEKCKDKPDFSTLVHGPNHTYQCDYDGIRKVEERMNNGFKLFGKYYRNLWD